MNFTNITLNTEVSIPKETVVTKTYHLIPLSDIFFIVLIYAGVLYGLYRFKHNPYWENPRGHKINVYKLLNIFLVVFTLAIVVAVIYQAVVYGNDFVQVCDRFTGVCE